MKLYVGNLPFSTTDNDLKELFEGAGAVTSTNVIVDRNTKRSRGFGFVEMENDEDGRKAIEMFHGYDMGGRPLTVNEARPLEPREQRSRY